MLARHFAMKVADAISEHNRQERIRAEMKAWEVRIAGPDDVIAFSDELEALRRANEVNIQYLADRLNNPNDEVLCVATVHEIQSETPNLNSKTPDVA